MPCHACFLCIAFTKLFICHVGKQISLLSPIFCRPYLFLQVTTHLLIIHTHRRYFYIIFGERVNFPLVLGEE